VLSPLMTLVSSSTSHPLWGLNFCNSGDPISLSVLGGLWSASEVPPRHLEGEPRGQEE
jgi:hypothetical protein